MTYLMQSPPQLSRSYSTESGSPLRHKRNPGYFPSDMQSQLELLRQIKQRNHQLRCILQEMQPLNPPMNPQQEFQLYYQTVMNQPDDFPEDLKAIFLSYFPIDQANTCEL
ncbi:hypothetical protein THRCLA_22305 [Thraustotheca clavata]|uniref:Uncharacterized protein n=1 Tax=Thraustotheca clavata TaxID=74557 RepID=A0A1V9Z6D1_9STRA|nr:hypothetical protein THRCLA_22305 [Thraustotheca clavata]